MAQMDFKPERLPNPEVHRISRHPVSRRTTAPRGRAARPTPNINEEIEEAIDLGNKARDEAEDFHSEIQIFEGTGGVEGERAERDKILFSQAVAQAKSYYRRAITLNSKEERSYYGLGNVYYIEGRHEDAERAYKQAIHLKPDFAEAYYGLGRLYEEQSRYTEAAAQYKSAIRVKPDFKWGYYQLGEVYYHEKSYADALAAYERGVRLDTRPRPDILNRLGELYFIQQRYSEAIAVMKDTMKNERDDYILGMAYLKVNDKSAAMKQYRRLNPKSDLAKKLLDEINKQ